MNDPIYKAQAKPYEGDLNDLVKAEIEKGGEGSGKKGHKTYEEEHAELSHQLFNRMNGRPLQEQQAHRQWAQIQLAALNAKHGHPHDHEPGKVKKSDINDLVEEMEKAKYAEVHEQENHDLRDKQLDEYQFRKKVQQQIKAVKERDKKLKVKKSDEDDLDKGGPGSGPHKKGDKIHIKEPRTGGGRVHHISVDEHLGGDKYRGVVQSGPHAGHTVVGDKVKKDLSFGGM